MEPDGAALRLPVVLASASPRRRALLGEAGVAFTVEPSDVEEPLAEFDDPLEAAGELARRKALDVARRRDVPALVLGADTVVALETEGGWQLLGKPQDESEARAMLTRLGGTRHAVVTGVCVVRTPDMACAVEAERTWVRMRPLASAEVEAYVASGEWRGKAGGYAIQESADRFVSGLEGGGFDNVVGLPVARARALLLRVQDAAPGTAPS